MAGFLFQEQIQHGNTERRIANADSRHVPLLRQGDIAHRYFVAVGATAELRIDKFCNYPRYKHPGSQKPSRMRGDSVPLTFT
jgi:hypothetical protein